MAPGGIEPTTFALLARRSNQLSYGAQLFLWMKIYINEMHVLQEYSDSQLKYSKLLKYKLNYELYNELTIL